MKTIAVVSTKGGSGKTTLSVNLALAAHLRGLRALAVDTDPQGSLQAALKARAAAGPQCMAASAGKLFQIQQTALRTGVDILLIDTPGRGDSDIAEAVRWADICVAVARPSFLDLTAAVGTLDAVRRLGRAGVVVLNQATSQRGGMDPDSVTRALKALRLTGFEASSAVVRARAVFQTSIAQGRSVEEAAPASAAAMEIAALWADLQDRLAPRQRSMAPRPAFLAAPSPAARPLLAEPNP